MPACHLMATCQMLYQTYTATCLSSGFCPTCRFLNTGRGFNGRIKVDHTNHKLIMRVSLGHNKAPVEDMKSLSGESWRASAGSHPVGSG